MSGFSDMGFDQPQAQNVGRRRLLQPAAAFHRSQQFVHIDSVTEQEADIVFGRGNNTRFNEILIAIEKVVVLAFVHAESQNKSFNIQITFNLNAKRRAVIL